jgi:hypothetical protein
MSVIHATWICIAIVCFAAALAMSATVAYSCFIVTDYQLAHRPGKHPTYSHPPAESVKCSCQPSFSPTAKRLESCSGVADLLGAPSQLYPLSLDIKYFATLVRVITAVSEFFLFNFALHFFCLHT